VLVSRLVLIIIIIIDHPSIHPLNQRASIYIRQKRGLAEHIDGKL